MNNCPTGQMLVFARPDEFLHNFAYFGWIEMVKIKFTGWGQPGEIVTQNLEF